MTALQTAESRPPLLPEGYGLGKLDNLPRAVVYMLLSAASFAVMGAMVKAAGDLPVHQKVFFRNLVTLVITVVMAWRKRQNPFGPTRHLSLLLVRSFAGLGGVFLYFYAIGHLTLADASLLVQISPFWVTVLAMLWLGERITRPIAWSLVVAFIGAALVIRPGFAWQPWPALAGFGASFCAGLSYAVVRKLKGREEPRRIVFYFSLISTVVMVPLMFWRHVMPAGWQWVWLVGTGVFAAAGQVLLTLAYHRAPAGRISIWSYNNVLFSLILGLAVWGEVPAPISLFGGTLIVAAAITNHRAR
ncbi:MAG: DMT family transporter [Candidatus Krumholzibacteria bacterium]|nr:DMT family transporter [Candidatus Krumholzibacteria bacterium]